MSESLHYERMLNVRKRVGLVIAGGAKNGGDFLFCVGVLSDSKGLTAEAAIWSEELPEVQREGQATSGQVSVPVQLL